MRPRVVGHQGFQTTACHVLRAFIEGTESADATVARLNDLWRDLRSRTVTDHT